MNIREAMGDMLAQAEEKFGYPLHVTAESSDENEVLTCVLPVRNGKPQWVKKPRPGPLPYPCTFIIRGWDRAAGKPKPEEMRALMMASAQQAKLDAVKPDTYYLLRQLDAEVPQHRAVAFAVHFPGGSAIFIRASDPDRQRHLDEAVEMGGRPIGMIAIDYEGDKDGMEHRLIRTRVFPEYPEAEADRILHEVAVQLDEQLPV